MCSSDLSPNPIEPNWRKTINAENSCLEFEFISCLLLLWSFVSHFYNVAECSRISFVNFGVFFFLTRLAPFSFLLTWNRWNLKFLCIFIRWSQSFVVDGTWCGHLKNTVVSFISHLSSKISFHCDRPVTMRVTRAREIYSARREGWHFLQCGYTRLISLRLVK